MTPRRPWWDRFDEHLAWSRFTWAIILGHPEVWAAGVVIAAAGGLAYGFFWLGWWSR